MLGAVRGGTEGRVGKSTGKGGVAVNGRGQKGSIDYTTRMLLKVQHIFTVKMLMSKDSHWNPKHVRYSNPHCILIPVFLWRPRPHNFSGSRRSVELARTPFSLEECGT